MACRETNEREKVRRGDGRRVASAHVSCAEVKWSGREDQVFKGRKIQRRAAGLSERGSGLSPTVTVGDGQKGNG